CLLGVAHGGESRRFLYHDDVGVRVADPRLVRSGNRSDGSRSGPFPVFPRSVFARLAVAVVLILPAHSSLPNTVVITLRVMVHHHAERDDYGALLLTVRWQYIK